eukprot:SAG31_NODE_14795_length_787_cov_1.042151_1_plen_125_part_00
MGRIPSFYADAQHLSFAVRKLYAAALKFAVSKMDVTVQILIDAVATTVNSVEQLYSVSAAVHGFNFVRQVGSGPCEWMGTQSVKGEDELERLEKLNEDGTLNAIGMAQLQDSVFEVVRGHILPI